MIYSITFNPALDVAIFLDTALKPGVIYDRAAWVMRPGGKGNNVARAIRQLGGAVIAVGFYGGPLGRLLQAELEELGIPVLSAIMDGSNRLGLTMVAGEAVTEIRTVGSPVSPAASKQLLQQLADRLGPQDWITISGSLPPGLSEKTVEAWVTTLKPRCRGILADLSGPALVAAWAAGATLICPNRAEYESVAALIRPSPTQHLVITDGASGIYWQGPDHVSPRHIPAPPVPVKNPVGAGDVFLGALTFFLHQDWSWALALSEAVRVAAASVTTEAVADIDQSLLATLPHPPIT